MSTSRLFTRAAALAAVAMLAGAGIASAHVTANVTEPAKKGGYAKITFRVPNEDDTQGTVKLTLNFPANPPVTSARPKPVPGWTTSVTKIDLNPPVTVGKSTYKQAIGTITWTAQPGTRINPGEFQEFDISAGPLPNADQLVIPATQTYDGAKGDVKWDQVAQAGQPEPQHPAPTVKLVNAGASEDAHGSGGTSADVQPAADSHTEAAAATSDNTARWLGGIGLVLGALGLGLGVGATLRSRRRPAAKSGAA